MTDIYLRFISCDSNQFSHSQGTEQNIEFLFKISHKIRTYEVYFVTERPLLETWCELLNCLVDHTRKFNLSKYQDDLNNVKVFGSYM